MLALRNVPSWTWQLPIFLLHVAQHVSANEIDLHQTVPENRIACPGEKLQYTCTSPLSDLSWMIGSLQPVEFSNSAVVNSNKTINDFFLLLTEKNASSSTSTATNEMVASEYDGQLIACYSGDLDPGTITIAVAGGPADCSNMSTMPKCHATTNAMDDTETVFSITLKTTSSLMCVEGYQIQFNGESENVSLSSPSANFTITEGEGEPVQNEIVVYTLDYESRTGQVPCTFNIPVPDAVQKLLKPECITKASQNVDITFHWVEGDVDGCLEGNAPILYIVEFNDSQFSNGTTTRTGYTVTNVTQETVVEITISPSLPFLGLTGSPLSEIVNLATINCLPTTFSTTTTPPMNTSAHTTPNTTAPSGNDNEAVVLSVIVLGLIVVILGPFVMFIFIMRCLCNRNKGYCMKKTTRHICATNMLHTAIEMADFSEEMTKGMDTGSPDAKKQKDVSNTPDESSIPESDDHSSFLGPGSYATTSFDQGLPTDDQVSEAGDHGAKIVEQRDKAAYEQRIRDLETAIAEAENAQEDERRKAGNLEKVQSELQYEVHVQEKRIEHLKNKLELADQTGETFKEENEELKQQFEDLCEDRNQKVQEIEKLKQELKDLHNDRNRKVQEIEQLDNDLKLSRQREVNLSRDIESLRGELCEMREQFDQVNKELHQMNKRMNSLQGTMMEQFQKLNERITTSQGPQATPTITNIAGSGSTASGITNKYSLNGKYDAYKEAQKIDSPTAERISKRKHDDGKDQDPMAN